MYDIAVVGGGIIGAACAYTLSKYKLKIAVLEKKNDVSAAQQRQTAPLSTRVMIRIPAQKWRA